MLDARDLKKRFVEGDGEFVVFEHISFSVQRGEFIVITGRSGSGKSTLLYQLGLLDMPDAGTVVVEGIDTRALSRRARSDLRLDQFGYVFQDYGLMPEMSAVDNVMLPLIMRGESTRAAYDTARVALEQVGLGDRLENKPSRLSGGQQQRVSIARAIAHAPAYILADEPTANLDSASATQILNVFGAIHQAGATIIMVTHEKESLELASRILNLDRGVLSEIQPLSQSPTWLPSGI